MTNSTTITKTRNINNDTYRLKFSYTGNLSRALKDTVELLLSESFPDENVVKWFNSHGTESLKDSAIEIIADKAVTETDKNKDIKTKMFYVGLIAELEIKCTEFYIEKISKSKSSSTSTPTPTQTKPDIKITEELEDFW